MDNSGDAIKIAVAIWIATIVTTLVIFVVNKGTNFFNKQTETMDQTLESLRTVESDFDNKVVTGREIVMSYQEHYDAYKYYVQTLWMKQEGISAYEYGGDDASVTKEMYRDKNSRFYFTEEAEYTASLVIKYDEVVGFLFVQREG